ncbi:T9SS type A sorting domain-containing protein, partial [bacterium AH-315-C07]|nr:T9SS type A sorting domain-containing protein [bacterium AH-315-C07]
ASFPVAIDSVVITSSNLTCNGDTSGSASAQAYGGTTPYNYSWTTGSTATSVANLTAGTYTVTVTDSMGVISISSVIITEPTIGISTSISNVTCNAVADGSVTISAWGGSTPYTYSWSNGSTSNTISNLSADTLWVTVTDANMCWKSKSVIVTEPTILMSAVTSWDVSCGGLSDGSANVSAWGGATPYTYSWSNDSTSSSISNLSADTLWVTVMDANMCWEAKSVVVTGPAELMSSVTSWDLSCAGLTDGSANVSVWGGATPYTYSWSNGSTSSLISSLSADTLWVTVTDANMCWESKSVVVAEPAALMSAITSWGISCEGLSDGSAKASAWGGTASYNYSWTTGETSNMISSVSTGSYYVTITDANNCMIMDTAIVADSNQISIYITEKDITCSGDADGSISVSASGGTSPYSYSWSTDTTLQNLSNLGPGTWVITVSDNSMNCSFTSVTINEPKVLSGSLTAWHIKCKGSSDGMITSIIYGGTSPFSYKWSDGANTTSGNVANLGIGSFNVTVWDANGCKTDMSETITEPDTVFSVSYTINHISCDGYGDGSASVAGTGGVTPYSYSWASGDTTSSVDSLATGTHNSTVWDAGGCAIVSTITVINPSAISTSTDKTDVLCNGLSTGDIDLTVSGGTTPYTYSWSNGIKTEDINYLPTKTYTVVVTDANGCEATKQATISQPSSAISLSTSSTTPPWPDPNTATVVASGGTPPYTYVWSNGDTTASVEDIPYGIVTVVVTDANDCHEAAQIDMPTGVNDLELGKVIKVYPNPSDGYLNIQLDIPFIKTLSLSIFDQSGKVIYHSNDKDLRILDLSSYPNGVYNVKVNIDDQTTIVKEFILNK